MNILAIDNGTQSVRALLFDLKGNLLAKSKVDLEPYFSESPGWAEQHPEYFWKNLCKACNLLWREKKVSRDSLAGVAVWRPFRQTESLQGVRLWRLRGDTDEYVIYFHGVALYAK